MARADLGSLPAGATGVVTDVTCPRPVARRLMEMGLLPGTPIQVVRVAPLGDPIELRVRGYALSIRRAEAAGITLRDVIFPGRAIAPAREGAT